MLQAERGIANKGQELRYRLDDQPQADLLAMLLRVRPLPQPGGCNELM